MYKKVPIPILLAVMLLLTWATSVSIVQAKSGNQYEFQQWVSSASPIKITGISDDGKYPVYDIEGEPTDLTYKSGNLLYTSGDLVHMLVFLSPADAKSKRYYCEFLCKDTKGRAVGLNPSFKFLVQKELLK